MTDAIEASAALVVSVDNVPRGLADVCVGEHRFFGFGIILPTGAGFEVHFAEFPAFGGVSEALLEAALLFGIADREPVFDEDDAGADEHAFEFRAGAEELTDIGFRAKPHDAFDAGAVVPGAVEEDHLAGSGEMGNIALKVPLSFFTFGGDGEGDDADDAGIELLSDAFNHAAFASGIAAFEDNDDFEAFVTNPFLEFDKFGLEAFKFGFVEGFVEAFAARARRRGRRGCGSSGRWRCRRSLNACAAGSRSIVHTIRHSVNEIVRAHYSKS